jgi:2,3-bisphosphoglycerate-independent phosphoglycerate mutase
MRIDVIPNEDRAMKFVVLVGDGMADRPLDALQGRTPLQVAQIPHMDRLAEAGRCGLARTVPEGMPPGSDVANLSIFGYPPQRYYSGRAPLEAAAMGIRLEEGETAFRCNLVTVRDGVMEDYSAGHISSEEGSELILALRPLMPGGRIYAGVSYRNLLVLKAGREAICTPPHDISGRPIRNFLPRGEDSRLLNELMEAALPVLASHPVNQRRLAEGKHPANMIWLWGQGGAPAMPSFPQRYGLAGAVISAVDLLKGIGIYAGLEVISVPGATGTIDTDYQGKVEACLSALARLDLVYLHIEAPDEAAHEGDLEQKVRAIELFDRRVVRPVLQGLGRWDDQWRVLMLSDHATSISTRTHSRDPVPFVLAGKGIEPDGVNRFSEEAARMGGFGLVEASELVKMMIQDRHKK